MKKLYADLLGDDNVIIFDGALGTYIQKKYINQLKESDALTSCNENLNLTIPSLIQSIHEEYIKAGAQVISTNSFGANRLKLKEFGLEGKVSEINHKAVENARNAIRSANVNHPVFIAGSLGPTGYLLSSNKPDHEELTFHEIGNIYREQAIALIDAGADLLLFETGQDLLELRAGMIYLQDLLAERNISLPIQVQITMDATNRMLLGSDILAFLGAISNLNPSAIGINCGAGPEELSSAIETLLQFASCPVALEPNAGAPKNIDGKAFYDMSPDHFAEKLVSLVKKHNLKIVGGCCGTTPEHIRALAESCKGIQIKKVEKNKKCFLSTGLTGIDLETINPPIIIGERLNAQGSKKTKELLLDKNYQELYHIGLEQENAHSHLLDLSVAVNEIDDEKGMMVKLVSYLHDRISVPFCIDSTDPIVIEHALTHIPGSAMINSINLEDLERTTQILKLALRFGCPVIALPINNKGMAKTIDEKVRLADDLYNLACVDYKLPSHFLYFDPLVFTLATGDSESRDAAVNSLETLKILKAKYTEMNTVMGVSNVSFGLSPQPRRVLNNLMLYHGVKCGLDAAIFNPLHLDKVDSYSLESRTLGENLLFNKTQNALNDYINYFESNKPQKKQSTVIKKQLLAHEELYQAVLSRDSRNLTNLIDNLLKTWTAADILNKILLPAMDEVGKKMASGDLILPFVLQSAQIMKEASDLLAPHLRGQDNVKKGKLLLATVYGDVHDIGKNLVGSILKNQGYDVIDLGKQVPIDTIIEKVKTEKPDAVGLSALLVTTSKQMALCVKEFHKHNLSIPIIIGGAAVSQEFAERIAILEDGSKYEGGIYFGKDAFEAQKILNDLNTIEDNNDTEDIYEEEIQIEPEITIPEQIDTMNHGQHVDPPFYGTNEILTWEDTYLIDKINTERLFKSWWRGGNLSKEEYLQTEKELFSPAFKNLTQEIMSKQLIEPRGFYGFFPIITDDTEVILLDPENFHSELLSFTFPRQEKKQGLSYADYFRPEGDVIGIQINTIGNKLSDRCGEYFNKEDNYNYGFMLHGIGNYLVEDIADRLTKEIRRCLGIHHDLGRRLSFGYPGMPALEEQQKLLELINAEDRLNITLTQGFQMEPEHSTAAIFVHSMGSLSKAKGIKE